MPAATSETPLWKPSRQKCSGFQTQGQLEADLKKSRKVYFVDTGVRNALINILNAPDLRSDVGGLWENFVIAERMKQNHNQRLFPDCYFRRSRHNKPLALFEAKENGRR